MFKDVRVQYNNWLLPLFFPDFCRAQLFDLAVSLLPGLGPQETDVLFTAIIPALKVFSLLISLLCFNCSIFLILWNLWYYELQDVDGLIQKKAYKVLSIILKVTNLSSFGTLIFFNFFFTYFNYHHLVLGIMKDTSI